MVRETAGKVRSCNIMQIYVRYTKNVNFISRAMGKHGKVLYRLEVKPHFCLKGYAALQKCD